MSGIDKPRLRALIYNRVSADSAGQRVSVESQEAENRAFCQQRGWDVAATITDNDRSASRHATREREGYQQVRAALAGTGLGRIDALVCWESSRAQRDLAGYVAMRDLCTEHGVLLAYKGRVYDLTEGDDRFTTGLDALLDEREAERARDRTLRSHRDSVNNGKPRGVTPYGYARTYDQASGRMLAQHPHPDTAPVVQEIVDRILAGDTLYRVAADLNRRGVLTPRGHRDHLAGLPPTRGGWSSSMIRNLLHKHSLSGIRTHHGLPVGDATWEPIVAPDRWTQLQAILDDPARGKARGVAARHLLSGIAECGVCGAWLRPLTNRGRPTYVCAGLVPTAPKGHVSRLRGPVDAMAVVAVLARLKDPNLLSQLGGGVGEDPTVIGAVREVADLRARLAQFEESAVAGGISAPAFARIEARLLPLIDDAQHRAVPRRAPVEVQRLAGPDASDLWAVASLEVQRQVIRALVRVVVHRSTRGPGTKGFDPSTIDIINR